MRLQRDPSLAAPTGFNPEQLADLTRSVEAKKHKLELDIQDYVRSKQEDLDNYERELVDAMEPSAEPRPPTDTTANAQPQQHAHDSHQTRPDPDSRKLGPDEKAKRTKHTRVHKREKELCGLVTPIFLPLLDAGDASPTKKRKEKKRPRDNPIDQPAGLGESPPQVLPSRDADERKESHRSKSKSREEKMGFEEPVLSGDGVTESSKAEGKKAKRSPVKKSSLRHSSTPRTRRKRVSLVIDDQIVHPSDNIESALASPSEMALSTTSTSTTTSTASLDDTIDPRLAPREDAPVPVHQDAVHHSLPSPTTLPITSPPPPMSPTKHTGHTLAESPKSMEPEWPKTQEQEPPQSKARTHLDSSPSDANLIIPPYAGAAPIYANEPDITEVEEEEDEFSTYVGGISGSGVDDVDQTGSLGYPSSLGASYLESYMQSRPLSVRMAAAEKAELDDDEKARLMRGNRDDFVIEKLEKGKARVVDEDDDMDVIGSMEEV